MAFVATGCPGADASLLALAQIARCPVNVVDQPSLCDIPTPSIVERAPVVVAIGTEGTAPVLARQIKARIEEILPQNIGGLAAFAGRMRAMVAHRIPRENRRGLRRWVFANAPAQHGSEVQNGAMSARSSVHRPAHKTRSTQRSWQKQARAAQSCA